MTMRLLGAVLPFKPRAVPEMIVGKAEAADIAETALMNSLLRMLFIVALFVSPTYPKS